MIRRRKRSCQGPEMRLNTWVRRQEEEKAIGTRHVIDVVVDIIVFVSHL